ncbi:MAG: Sec-independent protein translocase subunit TatA/TatB [Acidimicrobiales bacterium]
MGGFDPAKIIVVLMVALVVLGPERLPRAARQLGAAWRELTKIRERVEDEVRSAMPDVDLAKIPALPRTGIAGYLTGMMTSADQMTRTATIGDAEVVAEDGMDAVSWSASRPGGEPEGIASASPLVSPSGIPAGWQSAGAPAPGYGSGSLLSTVPSGAPDGVIAAQARVDLGDPSWN